MTSKQWQARKTKVVTPIKYFWKTMKLIEIPNVLNGKVIGAKTVQVPDQGQYFNPLRKLKKEKLQKSFDKV